MAGRAALVACLVGGLQLWGGPPGRAAPGQDVQPPPVPEDNELEPFEEVDPYTGGEDAALERLGYESFGPFGLPGGTTTLEVHQTLGGIPLLWVETAHFKLGSSLKTYRLRGDRREGRKLEAELERLRERLGRLRAPRNALDPWLRLHLYAQRLEELYAGFEQAFALHGVPFGPTADGMGIGPHLGQQEKFLVLVLEKASSLGRYTGRHLGVEQVRSYRAYLPDGGMFYGNAAETMRQGDQPLDAALHSYLAFGVASNLCDSFRNSFGAVPVWFKYGLAHRFSREVDPRWSVYEGAPDRRTLREDAWEWEPRVRGLVLNDVAPSWEQMLAWKDHTDLDRRAHMMVWSRVDWLLAREGGRPLEFLLAVSEPWDLASGPPSLERRLAAQHAGFQAAWGASAAELEAEWAAHVRKRYARR